MNIGIDARLIYETGVGRYIRNLISGLNALSANHEYYLYLTKEGVLRYSVPSERFHKRIADVRWHTVKEQIVLPRLYTKDRLDVLHVPYFTIPLLYDGAMVATIHDLTILHVQTGKASTHLYPFYLAKRLGYQGVLYFGLTKCKHIISVSKTTKEELISHFRINPGKIHITYEGIDTSFLSDTGKIKSPQTPYFLYVGNAYPHKNLSLLLDAFSLIDDSVQKTTKLIFVGSDDVFYQRVLQQARRLHIEHRVELRSGVTDEELKILYQQAIALLFPSLMEGFGLPALEALVCACPVVVSDIPIFRELLPSSVKRLPPTDPSVWANEMTKMRRTSSDRKRDTPKDSLISQITKTYSWENCSKKTLAIYELCNSV